MSTKKVLAAAALLVAGATGQALYTSTTPQQARQEIAAAHDVSTRHGELTVRADAGGADVTALVAVTPPTAPGQVFTSDDAGLPTWRAAATATTLHTYTAADFVATQGHASTSASIVSGRLRLSVDAAVRRYGTVSGTWTTTAPRGVLTLPAGVREVIVATRVYAGNTNTSWIGVNTMLRNGADPADVADNAAHAGIRLPGTLHWDQSGTLYGGELRADSYPAGIGITTANWSASPTAYHGVRWVRGAMSYVGATATTPGIDDVYGYSAASITPDWSVPTQVIVALQQYGGALVTSQVDLDIYVWTWVPQ